MKKIFTVPLDIGGKDNVTFEDFNRKLLRLSSTYRRYYNKALELLYYSNPTYSSLEALQSVLSQNRDLVTSRELLKENKGIFQASSRNAWNIFQKSDTKQLEDLIKDDNSCNYFYLESDETFVNAGAYLTILYNGAKQIKIRLADEYIPKGFYPRAKFSFNGKKWVVSLQSSQDEEAFKIKKFKMTELSILLCEDGSGYLGDLEFPSILENEQVQEIWSSLGEEWREYNLEKSYLDGKTSSLSITLLREVNTLRRRCRDSNRGYYLSLINKLVRSCPKKIFLSSSADFSMITAKKVDLYLFVKLLEQATSLYGIDLELNLEYPVNEEKCMKC